mmetsp:Transcript_21043/g.35495  ORF Transcript_21043/g.35495 Transcript_21043/m.35495 type:complete len:236 (-) Transcript_21043:673-1380(-)
MHIIFSSLGHIKVAHKFDTLYIESTSRDVSSDHERQSSISEISQHFVSLLLTLIAMNSTGNQPLPSQRSSQLVTSLLRLHKNQASAARIIFEVVHVEHKSVIFVIVRHTLNDLLHIDIRSKIQAPHIDLVSIFTQEVSGKSLHFLRPSGRPQQSLTIRANLTHNLSDLGLKTHIQHAISLVQHQVGDTTEVGGSILQMVDETARSRNDDLNTTSQIMNLGPLGHSSVHTGVLDVT